MKIHTPRQPRRFLYGIAEYIDGQTLRQWMHDHPQPEIDCVRKLVEQIGSGLQAMHRMEMVHRDIKPENILIDGNGTVRIIDFGSTRVAGIAEISAPFSRRNLLGTRNYTAPEQSSGHPGDQRCDLYALGVIAYEMLTQHRPYPDQASNLHARRSSKYIPVHSHVTTIPAWLDGALARAVHPDPAKRYSEISEFLYDLRHPNPQFLNLDRRPLLERNPAGFWRGLSIALFLLNLLWLLILTHK
jgi:serine/threonine protein kinase